MWFTFIPVIKNLISGMDSTNDDVLEDVIFETFKKNNSSIFEVFNQDVYKRQISLRASDFASEHLSYLKFIITSIFKASLPVCISFSIYLSGISGNKLFPWNIHPVSYTHLKIGFFGPRSK